MTRMAGKVVLITGAGKGMGRHARGPSRGGGRRHPRDRPPRGAVGGRPGRDRAPRAGTGPPRGHRHRGTSGTSTRSPRPCRRACASWARSTPSSPTPVSATTRTLVDDRRRHLEPVDRRQRHRHVAHRQGGCRRTEPGRRFGRHRQFHRRDQGRARRVALLGGQACDHRSVQDSRERTGQAVDPRQHDSPRRRRDADDDQSDDVRPSASRLENPTEADVAEVLSQRMLLPVAWVESIDVSNAVLFLASDESRYVTGLQMVIDAGQTQKVA